MSKFLIRCTVILVAAYLLVCYLAAAVFGVDIWSQWYYLLFELCLCLCISRQGVYHCHYIKWTAYAILIEETLGYTLLNGVPVIMSVAISFFMAYTAVWFNLLLGVIDTIYSEIYESTFASEAADTEDTETEMP